jgi:prevent-host-death family protein
MEVGAFEAKNKLSNLLERAERGEEIVITRRGKPVARLVPFDGQTSDRDKARKAAEGIRKLARELKLGKFDWEEWKKYRDEGRP